MKSLEKLSRRKLLKSAITIGGVGLLAGCRTFLPVNTLSGFGKGTVNLSEDSFEIQKIKLFEDYYFAVPIITDTRKLKGGEPSFALIPEKKARVSITQVGEKGGRVDVDAPEKDLYLPCAYNGKEKKVSPSFNSITPVRLITNFNMKDSLKSKEDKKIDLAEMTEQDFPFSDELLKAVNGIQYVINKIGDIETIEEHEKILPIYFTQSPFKVEYDETQKDKKIMIVGNTFLFKKDIRLDNYIKERGIEEIKEEENAKSASTALTQD